MATEVWTRDGVLVQRAGAGGAAAAPGHAEQGVGRGPGSRLVWTVFVLSGLFFVAYGVMAASLGFFAMVDFRYLHRLDTILYYFPQVQIESMLWKVVLLLPASVLLALGLSAFGVQPRLVRPGREARLLAILSLVAVGIIVLLIRFAFRGTEITDDEITYDFQAKTLLMGRLSNPPPPAANNFENEFIIKNGRHWVGKYSLGHPIMIALGMALGSRYAVTVLLSVATILLLYAVALELYRDRRVALLAACLGFVSPFFYFMSSTRLSHTTATFFLALFYWMVVRSRGMGKGGRWQALIGGLAVSYALNVRPMTAVAFGLPFAALMLADVWRRKEGAGWRLVACLAGFLVVFAGTAAYNAYITGSPLKFPFTYYAVSERPGFGVYGHTVGTGVFSLVVNVMRMNAFLFGFPLSLIFVASLLFFRKSAGDVLNVAIMGSVAYFFFLYYFPGIADIGPVYYYELFIPLVLLSARGAMAVHAFFRARPWMWRHFVPNFLVVSVVVAALTFVPERTAHVRRLTAEIQRPYEVVERAGVSNAVVLFASLPNQGWVFSYRNPWPDLRDDVVYGLYADGSSNLELVRRFPGRDFYVIWCRASQTLPVLQRVTPSSLAFPPVPPPGLLGTSDLPPPVGGK